MRVGGKGSYGVKKRIRRKIKRRERKRVCGQRVRGG